MKQHETGHEMALVSLVTGSPTLSYKIPECGSYMKYCKILTTVVRRQQNMPNWSLTLTVMVVLNS